ncbi:MAG: class I SAM-dependent methyltransferase [Ignavibacteriales bacterium]|nr:class I SAM-dependent methyltransferase [Ignavibacteriales bacterium]
MIEALRRAYRRELFQPGLLGIFVNPFFFARRGLYLHIRELGRNITGKTLDIGCGLKPYRDLCSSDQYIGLELDTPENRAKGVADVFYRGDNFPFSDGGFDSLLCNEVLEHVFTPEAFLREAHRVLKPGGHFMLTVPFVWDEHEQPRDYGRYSSFGIAALVQRCGFEIVEQRKSVDDLRVVVQLFIAYLYKKTVTRFVPLNIIVTAILMAPITLVGLILGWLFPRNSDLYLDNVLLLRKSRHA